MKKLTAILVALVLVIGVCVAGTVSASATNDISADFRPPPQRLSYINYTATNIGISGGEATCTGLVVGYNGTTTKIIITLYLEYKLANSSNWSAYADSSPQTTNGSSASLQMKVSGIPKGYQYRTHAVYKAYAGSAYEILDGYSSVVSY